MKLRGSGTGMASAVWIFLAAAHAMPGFAEEEENEVGKAPVIQAMPLSPRDHGQARGRQVRPMGNPSAEEPRVAGRRGVVPALLAAGVFLMACSMARENRAGASGSEVVAARAGASDSSRTAGLERALRDFERAVLERDTARFMQLLDAHYRQVEFEGFYRGVVPQFLNEFFCGKIPKGDQLFCLPFDGISELKRADLSGGEALAMVEYAVKTSDSEIRARLRIKLEKDGKVKGFIGSNGYTQVE